MGAKVLGARRTWWQWSELGREHQLEGTGKGGRDMGNNKRGQNCLCVAPSRLDRWNLVNSGIKG